MKLLRVILIIALPSFALAQSNYRAAYAVKTNGDTLKGYINLKEGHGTPKAFDFKTKPEDKNSILLTPNDVKSIQIKDIQNYIAYSGPLSMDKTTYPDLPDGMDSTKAQATVFLEVITSGEKVSLLSNNDDIKTRLFVKERGSLPVELIYHYYYIYSKENGPTARRTGEYKYQLSELVNKYSVMDKKTSELLEENYAQDNIEKIIWHINGGKGNVKTRSNTSFFAGLGGNYTMSQSNFTASQGFSSSSNAGAPVLTAGMNVFGNPLVQKFIFRLSLSYSNIDLNFTGSAGSLKLTQKNITLTPEVIYNIYNTDALKYFITGGANLIISNSNGPIDAKNAVNLTPDTFSPSWLGLTFKTGVTLNKKIEIYAMFNATVLLHGSIYEEQYQSIGAGINYIFGKTK